jgi:hypothetical protein
MSVAGVQRASHTSVTRPSAAYPPAGWAGARRLWVICVPANEAYGTPAMRSLCRKTLDETSTSLLSLSLNCSGESLTGSSRSRTSRQNSSWSEFCPMRLATLPTCFPMTLGHKNESMCVASPRHMVATVASRTSSSPGSALPRISASMTASR